MKLKKELLSFWEVDRGGEQVRSGRGYSLQDKVLHYNAYMDSGAYREDFGSHIRGFRVLFLVSGTQRAERICEVAIELEADHVWTSVKSEFLADAFGPIFFHGSCRNCKLIQSR